MLIRSPRRFAILALVGFVFVFGILQHSPWANERVYEHLPLFRSGSRPNLLTIPGLSNDRIGAHEDPAQVVVPDSSSNAALQNLTVAEPTPTKSYPPWITDPSRTEIVIPATSRPADMKEYLKSMLKWSRPSWDGHWPPFQDYINKAYDPNRWEQFPL